MTYLCYIDESGTPEVPGTTSHFILAGLAIPIDRWQEADRQITAILNRYDLADGELHTAWLVRAYPEQSRIVGFGKMNRDSRRSAVSRYRAGELLRLRKLKNTRPYLQAKKNYAKTADYVHLTRDERTSLIMKWRLAFHNGTSRSCSLRQSTNSTLIRSAPNDPSGTRPLSRLCPDLSNSLLGKVRHPSTAYWFTTTTRPLRESIPP